MTILHVLAKKLWRSALYAMPLLLASNALHAGEDPAIPLGFNSWAFDAQGVCVPTRKHLHEDKLVKWDERTHSFRTYFRVEKPGELDLSLEAASPAGASKIVWSYKGVSREAWLADATPQHYALGKITIDTPGYQYIEWRGLEKSGEFFADLQKLHLKGSAAAGEVNFIKEDSHFGRRGPSVHLRYRLPPAAREITWVYNELTVPIGMDPPGTFAMANGFGEGYFGMQVNSATERRILFSVWSPFQTDDPRAIPEADRVKLLAKGQDVNAKAFGGEGSGGQSYLVYPWKSGATYKFLLNVKPDSQGATSYTAYFYATEEARWRLIASFSRPRTNTYLSHWHSFLENFNPDTGAITREVQTDAQWARDKSGKWFEATGASFSVDNTARKRARLDYSGGVTAEGRFFMRNCGFIDTTTQVGTLFERRPTGAPPTIDFENLPRGTP